MRLFALVTTAALSGCTLASYCPGVVSCPSGNGCPSGYTCTAGLCEPNDGTAVPTDCPLAASSGGSTASSTAASSNSSSGTGASGGNSTSGAASCLSSPPSASVSDPAGNQYALTDGGQITRNGQVDPRTAAVIQLVAYGGLIFQQITGAVWWSTDGSNWPNSTWSFIGTNYTACDGGAEGIPIPPPAADAGFHTLVFNQGGINGWNVDTQITGAGGFDWYQSGDFFGAGNANPTFENTILTYKNNGLVSAYAARHGMEYAGYSFSSGLYVEAVMALDPTCVLADAGWQVPGLWSLPVEAEQEPGTTDAWPGLNSAPDAGYAHYAEIDYLRFPGAAASYLYDRWGVYDTTCSDGYCSCGNDGQCAGLAANGNITGGANVPSKTDWTQFNRYGGLLVPATLNHDAGFYQGYFNGLPTSAHESWNTYDPVLQPPPTAGQLFAVSDTEQFYLILSTSPDCPVKVASVRVWQAP